MKRPILQDKDPILRLPTEAVLDFDLELGQLIDDMIETMRGNNGIGLAAPQVGVSKKIIICEFKGEKEVAIPAFPLTVICNPEIVKASKENVNMVEGCLSFPGLELLIKRPKKVTVRGFDRYGNKIEISAERLFARALEHEIDHLNSTLMVDHLQRIGLVFIGTGTLGKPALEMLAKDPQYNIKLVVTGEQRDGNAIVKVAEKYKLPILRTKNIKDEVIVGKIRNIKPKIGVMADFGQIIPDSLLGLPKYGIINIHPSLLPKHRGPSPVQQTILNDDKETGVTLIKTESKMDAGGIISQVISKLHGTENAVILKEYLAKIGASLLLSSLPYYIAGDLKATPQEEKEATYTKLFKKEDGLVTLESDGKEIERKIRAFIEWPKTYLEVNGKRTLLLSAHLDTEGKIVIDRVKPEGKKEMTYDEYLRGYKTRLTFK